MTVVTEKEIIIDHLIRREIEEMTGTDIETEIEVIVRSPVAGQGLDPGVEREEGGLEAGIAIEVTGKETRGTG